MNELFDFLIKKDVEHKFNQPMAQYTSIRIGGIASVVAFPTTEEQLVDLIRYLHRMDIKYTVVGCMTNILPCDEEYGGVIIITRKLNQYHLNDTTVFAECGVAVSSLISRCAKLGLGGIESLCGIPGTLGGMIASNAGAYGCEIGDAIKSVRAYAPSCNQMITLNRTDLRFSYRSSIFTNSDMIILSAVLEFTPCDSEIIIEKMGMIKQKRAQTQPLEYPSLGSVFKRVNGVSAGQIIDQCGLKGVSVGGAMISPKHAGFIINTGGATAADFCTLIDIVKHEVYKQRAILLEEEIKCIQILP